MVEKLQDKLEQIEVHIKRQNDLYNSLHSTISATLLISNLNSLNQSISSRTACSKKHTIAKKYTKKDLVLIILNCIINCIIYINY